MTGGQREKPLKLDMPFAEALERFAATRSNEIATEIQTGKRGDMEPKQSELQLVHYQTTECQGDFTLDPSRLRHKSPSPSGSA